MSTDTTTATASATPVVGRAEAVVRAALRRLFSPRTVALFGIVLTLGAFLSVLHYILVITGEPRSLSYVVGGAALAGTVLARVIRPHTALLIGVVGTVAGTYLYISSLPGGFGFLVLLAPMLGDAVALLSGLSVLRIVNANVWALSAAPVPVFLAWYLALRRHYVAASAVAGAALGLLVLTGDATTTTTLAGVLGVTLAVSFGDCDRRGERLRNADALVVVLTLMVVLTLFVGVVPGATDSFVSTEGVGSQEATMESSLVHAGDSLAVAGSVSLSPEVRYTVEADEEAYWRVSSYDRYTGGGWVRTGETRTHEGGFEEPPGESRTLGQTFTAETSIATLPAAWQPTSISGVPVPVQETEGNDFQPASPLEAGESYDVESEVPTAAPADLRDAGYDYPDRVESRYTQLPSSTPDRVGERTDRLTANADNPYDTARVLEQWFHNNYEYTLNVERPRGDIADEFLFEMDAGYCTYFATTMVTMLRTQDIPARFVVGYTPGEQVDDNEWIVRGSNSHAWVEVYFPEHGWIEFDPTPPGPREETARESLEQAREDGSVDGDLEAGFGENTPEPPGSDGPNLTENETETPSATPTEGDGTDDGDESDEGVAIPTIPWPTREQLGVGLVILAGLVAGAHSTGIDGRLYRAIWVRRLTADDPTAAVEGAYRRVVHLEARAGRRKQPDETPRQFLADADEHARRVGELYERARYGPGVDETDAAEATARLAAILEERSRLPHLVGKRGTQSR